MERRNAMKRIPKPPVWQWPVRLSIWSIRHHDRLVAHLRIYVWSATATILLLSLANRISLTTALYAILLCSLSLVVLIWLLLERRRTILHGIQDAELRQEAESAMYTFIHARRERICRKHPNCGFDTTIRKRETH
jgi:heme exporter protein D